LGLGLSEGLGANFAECLSGQVNQQFVEFWEQWLKVLNPILPGDHDHDSDRQLGQVLLKLKVSVRRDEHVELARC
jgi:hypothetical protein